MRLKSFSVILKSCPTPFIVVVWKLQSLCSTEESKNLPIKILHFMQLTDFYPKQQVTKAKQLTPTTWGWVYHVNFHFWDKLLLCKAWQWRDTKQNSMNYKNSNSNTIAESILERIVGSFCVLVWYLLFCDVHSFTALFKWALKICGYRIIEWGI